MTLSQDKPITNQIVTEDDRTGLSINTLRRASADNLLYLQGKFPAIATTNDYYLALAYTIRDRKKLNISQVSCSYILIKKYNFRFIFAKCNQQNNKM